MDYVILMNWLSPFPTLGVSVFMIFRIKIPASKQCRPWSDAVFCGIWSMSALFACVSKRDARYKWVLKLKMPNITWASPEQGPYHIGKQGRLRQAWASVQSGQSHCCSHVQCEPPHDQTNKMTVRLAKTQISLSIRPVWSESSPCTSSCSHRRLWSDWVDAQADLRLRWAHMPFSWFYGTRESFRQSAISLALSNEPHLWPYPISHISGPIQWATSLALSNEGPQTAMIPWPLCYLSCLMTKPHVRHVRPRRLRSAWASGQSDQSSLSAWRKLGSLATHWVDSEDSDQTGQMPRLIWSDWADAQADLSLHWAHSHFVCFVMRWPTCQMAHLLSKWLTIFLVNESCSKQHNSMNLFHFTQFTDQQEISRNLSNMLNIEIQIHIWLLLKLLYEPKRPRGWAVSAPDFGSQGRGFESCWGRDSSRT